MRRYHDLDVLRGGAMLLGIVFHSCLAYSNKFAAEMGRSKVLDWFLGFSHAFRMPLFFFLAGFFGAMLLRREGSLDFARGRLRRLGIPLAVGLLTIVPLNLILKMQLHGQPLEITSNPMHLWFLEFLLLYSAAAVVLSRLPLSPAWTRVVVRLLNGPLMRLVLIAIFGALLLLVGAGTHGPRTLVPNAGKLIYFGAFYAAGWALWAGRQHLTRIRAYWPAYLLGGFVLSLFIGTVKEQEKNVPLEVGGLQAVSLDEAIHPILTVAVAWTMIFGLLGLGGRWFATERPTVRYIADASYWLYLVHIPIVSLLILALEGLPFPWPLEITLAVAANLAIGLLTYAAFVRHSAIGRVLHGPR